MLNVTTIEQVCWLNYLPRVLYVMSVVDQEPGSQDGHRWSPTAKPLFAREVDQEFRIRALPASWLLLAGRSWGCDPRQERN